jgi:hypothetical protein
VTPELVRKTVAETVRRLSDPAAKWTPELAARNLDALLDDEKLAGVGGAQRDACSILAGAVACGGAGITSSSASWSAKAGGGRRCTSPRFPRSAVAHLQWTLRQIFRMVVEERYLNRDPAEMLYIPRKARRHHGNVMSKEEVKKLLESARHPGTVDRTVGDNRRNGPGEILALTWGR